MERKADIILSQIRMFDPMALWAWGASDTSEYVAFEPSDTDLGALRFTVRNCRAFKGIAFVKIIHEFNDTYTVKLYKHNNSKKQLKEHIDNSDFKPSDFENVISIKKDVYFDELIPVIDEMLGEKKPRTTEEIIEDAVKNYKSSN